MRFEVPTMAQKPAENQGLVRSGQLPKLSVVGSMLPKLSVVGSIPIARSNLCARGARVGKT